MKRRRECAWSVTQHMIRRSLISWFIVSIELVTGLNKVASNVWNYSKKIACKAVLLIIESPALIINPKETVYPVAKSISANKYQRYFKSWPCPTASLCPKWWLSWLDSPGNHYCWRRSHCFPRWRSTCACRETEKTEEDRKETFDYWG